MRFLVLWLLTREEQTSRLTGRLHPRSLTTFRSLCLPLQALRTFQEGVSDTASCAWKVHEAGVMREDTREKLEGVGMQATGMGVQAEGGLNDVMQLDGLLRALQVHHGFNHVLLELCFERGMLSVTL